MNLLCFSKRFFVWGGGYLSRIQIRVQETYTLFYFKRITIGNKPVVPTQHNTHDWIKKSCYYSWILFKGSGSAKRQHVEYRSSYPDFVCAVDFFIVYFTLFYVECPAPKKGQQKVNIIRRRWHFVGLSPYEFITNKDHTDDFVPP